MKTTKGDVIYTGKNVRAELEERIEAYKRSFEAELSQKMKKYEAELRADFNNKIDELGKELISIAQRNNVSIDATTVQSPNCDYLDYKEVEGGISITGFNNEAIVGADLYIPAVIDGKRVVEIGDRAFGSNGFIQRVEIEHGIERVGNFAFHNCTVLKGIYFPDSVKTIGRECMRESKQLESIRLPRGLKVLEYGVMYQTAIKSIELPEGLVEIGTHAFGGCYSLCQVNIPSSVTTIKNYAFYYTFHNTTTLGTIFIPSSVRTIEADAFGGCKKLSIRCAASSKPLNWNSKWNSSNSPVTWSAR